jgi:hypothetical protein
MYIFATHLLMSDMKVVVGKFFYDFGLINANVLVSSIYYKFTI